MFLRKRIHRCPYRDAGLPPSCSVGVLVQPVHCLQFFPVVAVGQGGGVARAFFKAHSVRVVIAVFYYLLCLVQHFGIVALVVFQVVVIEAVLPIPFRCQYLGEGMHACAGSVLIQVAAAIIIQQQH